MRIAAFLSLQIFNKPKSFRQIRMAAVDTADSHKDQFDMNAPLRLITDVTPLCQVKSFNHLGISVSNRNASIEFYSKIGFKLLEDKSSTSVSVMKNRGFVYLV